MGRRKLTDRGLLGYLVPQLRHLGPVRLLEGRGGRLIQQLRWVREIPQRDQRDSKQRKTGGVGFTGAHLEGLMDALGVRVEGPKEALPLRRLAHLPTLPYPPPAAEGAAAAADRKFAAELRRLAVKSTPSS